MSVTPSQWRQFNFFELENADNLDQDTSAQNEAFKRLTLPFTITSPHSTSPLVSSVAGILCDATGQIVVLDKQFKEQRRWLGWDTQGTTELAKEEAAGYNLGLVPGSKSKRINRERGLILIECGGLLIGIGEDDSPSQSQFPLLRIWDLRVDRDKSAPPTLLRNVRIGTGGRGYPVSTLALTPNLSYLAIGLVSGQVLLYRHLLQSLSAAPSALSNFPKARVVWEGTAAEPITGLGFRLQNPDRTATKGGDFDHERTGESSFKLAGAGSVGLFIVTTHKTITVPTISGKGSEPRVLEETGASLHCSVMDLEQRFLIIGREDGIYTYDTEGRGSCFAYEGSKAAITTHGHSIVVISPPFTPTPASHSATVRRSAISAGASSRGEAVKVTVFDLENKLISYSNVFQDGVRDVFGEDGRQFCLWDGRREIWKLVEVPVEDKLEALIRKSLFQLAASMAKMADLDETVLADIYLRYGDHLYEKGDMDGSIVQYVKTLGWVQPSYIIRKYLEAHRIQHLTVYLQELHGQNLATPDHTTLLLNCYAKTLDKARLDAFIKSETSRTGSDDLPFDLDTAIRVCRQAGFHEHAVYLAKRYERHSDYLKIQLEDRDNLDAVLVYLRSLPQGMVAELVSPHVKHLLRRHPEATTELLIAICTEWDTDQPADNRSTAPSDGFRLPAAASANDSRSYPRSVQRPESPDRTSPAASKPSPQRYFSDYINHASEFIRFLETVAWKRWNQRVEARSPRVHSQLLNKPLPLDHHKRTHDTEHLQQQAVWNTLLELYLDSETPSEETDQNDGRRKALSLLDTIALLPLDPIHAMMLCSHFSFEAGLMSLWQRYGMYEEIARYWKQKMGDSANATTQLDGRTPAENLLHYLHMYGPVRPQLYPLVLRYVTSSPLILSRHGEEIRDILNTIDRDHIMPPLAVLQLLSRNEVTSVGVIKTWLRSQIEGTAQNLDSDKQLVQSYRTETEEKLREIASLNDPKQPQVFQVTRCASCGGQLDLPSVHFMCKHGYHQRCLPDSDPECPACARQHALIREMRRNQAIAINQHGAFLAEVHDSTTGFDVVAGAYSRGLLNVKATEGEL